MESTKHKKSHTVLWNQSANQVHIPTWSQNLLDDHGPVIFIQCVLSHRVVVIIWGEVDNHVYYLEVIGGKVGYKSNK